MASERLDFRAGVRYMLETDPDVCLLVWMHMPHPDLPPLLSMLQAEYRGRHVSVYHMRGTAGQTEAAGLGLAIVKHAAERLGARITLQSELGQGTTVTLLLPNRADGCTA